MEVSFRAVVGQNVSKSLPHHDLAPKPNGEQRGRAVEVRWQTAPVSHGLSPLASTADHSRSPTVAALPCRLSQHHPVCSISQAAASNSSTRLPRYSASAAQPPHHLTDRLRNLNPRSVRRYKSAATTCPIFPSVRLPTPPPLPSYFPTSPPSSRNCTSLCPGKTEKKDAPENHGQKPAVQHHPPPVPRPSPRRGNFLLRV